MKVVVGFDPPSICNLGFAKFSINESRKTVKLVEAGVVSLEKSYDDEIFDYDFAVKTAKLEDFLVDFYVDNDVAEIVIEQQILGKKGNRFASPFLIAQTNNMSTTLQRMAYRNNVERNIIHNKTLKKNITGSGAATKEDVMAAVMDILDLNIDYDDNTEKQYIKKYEHTYDAMALVLGRYMGLGYSARKYKKKFRVKIFNI